MFAKNDVASHPRRLPGGTIVETRTRVPVQGTLRTLIVEDELAGQRLMERLLSPYGKCDLAVDGKEAFFAFLLAWDNDDPYDLICLDIIVPEMDGQDVLQAIRTWERGKGIPTGQGVKIIMTTVLTDKENVLLAYTLGCEAYVFKPIDKTDLLDKIGGLGLIP